MISSYKKVYICYPYSDDPDSNIEAVCNIAREISQKNLEIISSSDPGTFIIPIAVHLLFPRFMSEEVFSREVAMECCFRVLLSCDEIWVCGPRITEGMRQEISKAARYDIRIVWRNFE